MCYPPDYETCGYQGCIFPVLALGVLWAATGMHHEAIYGDWGEKG